MTYRVVKKNIFNFAFEESSVLKTFLSTVFIVPRLKVEQLIEVVIVKKIGSGEFI